MGSSIRAGRRTSSTGWKLGRENVERRDWMLSMLDSIALTEIPPEKLFNLKGQYRHDQQGMESEC